MKHGWRLVFIPLAVACIAGAALVLFLALAWVSAVAFVAAALIGLGLGVPFGLWATKKVRKDDPEWSERRSEHVPNPPPVV
ncbi:hypothetical protein [Vannielia litorea]|uniref:Uncharacterized protein n=1 Tax=Vannielia litorea TaxID=1217970 RepID=A0A1N6EEM5_9RHOB|nr:hypothetical protein [Vannielia litorea]SIN81456.1 hypothetical protein SAMN05444002_0677 [Vannielia litorea]